MPELPEVETIRAGLERLIIGQSIADVKVAWAKTWPVAAADLKSHVLGRNIKSLGRRSKVLVMNLSNSYSLLFHFKMTGNLVFVRFGGERYAGGHPSTSMAAKLPDSSTRVVFTLKSGDKFFFNDQRKFGWIKLVKTTDIDKDSLIARLGPEPLTSEFKLAGLHKGILRHPRAPIKAIILDQSTVSGVGNIYADESLHLAKLHPASQGVSLTANDTKRLYESIKTIIRLGVEHGGTSFASYVNALGKQGDYMKHARVFRRQGKPCSVCGTKIEKLRVAGRGTHVCPKCQRML